MTWKRIHTKRVYTREQHHNVLEAWAEARDEAGRALPLISLDYHTDTLLAFNEHTQRKLKKTLGRAPTLPERDEACATAHAAVDWRDRAQLKDAVTRLSHDEHIDCAVRAGIVSQVFIVLGCFEPGHIPTWADVLVPPCPLGHVDAPHDEACVRSLADGLLEDERFGPQLAAIEAKLGGAIQSADYILDIDLDFFRTLRGIQPERCTAFHRLIRASRLITVAEEPGCVGMLRLHGESIVSSELATELNRHIAEAGG